LEQNNELAVKAEHIPIYRIEQALRSLPQIEIPVAHDFCKGIYARTILIPAGTLLTGAVHKDECFFLIRNGCILITTDDKPVQAESGFMVKSKAGSKRAGYAVIDTLVTTFHSNHEELRDPDEIWDKFTVPAPDNIIDFLSKVKLGEI
jgi:hypothetical protein